MNIKYYDYEKTTGYKTAEKGYYSYLDNQYSKYLGSVESNFGEEIRILYDKEKPRHSVVVEESWQRIFLYLIFIPFALSTIWSVAVLVKQGPLRANQGIQAGIIVGLYGGGLLPVFDYKLIVAGPFYDFIYNLFHLF